MPPNSWPQSRIMGLMPMHSEVHLTMAINSASAELVVTWFWVRDHPLIKCDPSIMAPPLVDLPVTRHPAQSESLYAIIFSSFPCHAYLVTNRPHPLRYRAIRFNFIQRKILLNYFLLTVVR